MSDKEKVLAQNVLEAVGGLDNVRSVSHCMTRLRFTLKDEGAASDEAVKKIAGVLGVVRNGGQYQVIVGPTVPEVYGQLVSLGVSAGGTVDENLDKDLVADGKKKWTASAVGNAILDYVSAAVIPLIPVLVVGGLFKTLNAVFGPTMLNLVPADSEFTFACDMVYQAAFYFIPVLAGASAAKKLGANAFMGAFMGAILIAPMFVELASSENPSFSVFGIPAPVLAYGQTLVPVLLSVAVMAPIEKFLNAKLPVAVRTVFAPFLTFVIMYPLSLCVLAPLGNFCGQGIGAFFNWIANTPLGWAAAIFLAGFAPLLVVTGMHVALYVTALAQYTQVGYDTVVLLAIFIGTFTSSGVGLAAWLKFKDLGMKNLALGYFITQFVGGIGEPLLFGIMMRYKRPWLGVIFGGFAAGAYAVITGVRFYAPASGLLSMLAFAGGSTANFVNGCIGMFLGMAVAFVVTWFFGFTKEDLEAKEEYSKG